MVSGNFQDWCSKVVSVLIVVNTCLSFPLPLVPVFKACSIAAVSPRLLDAFYCHPCILCGACNLHMFHCRGLPQKRYQKGTELRKTSQNVGTLVVLEYVVFRVCTALDISCCVSLSLWLNNLAVHFRLYCGPWLFLGAALWP